MDRRTFFTWLGLGWLAASDFKLTSKVLANGWKSVKFYVAPNGKDTWSGNWTTPNASRTDGPFATLARARDAIRELKRHQGGKLQQPITVMVRGGTYFLNEPLEFTSKDSGSAGFPISYQAYWDEKPTISGGRPIKGWKIETVNGKTMWTVTLPEVQSGQWYFQQLWVNGQRRYRARYPSRGYLQIQSIPAAEEKPWDQGQDNFQFYAGDLKAWSSVSGGEAVVMNRWVDSHLPIDRIDEARKTIYFTQKSRYRLDSGDAYYVENILEFFDTPGEWCLNKNTGKLYYYPMPGEDINKLHAIAPVLVKVIICKGNSDTGEYVKHLKFRNLTFSHTHWQLPSNMSSTEQSAPEVPGAIYGEVMQYCSFEKCTITHIGNYGIELSKGCQNNQISKCQIFDMGAGGVKLNSTLDGTPRGSYNDLSIPKTSNNKIIACRIHNGGRFYHDAAGIWIGHSSNNRISKNHIHNFYYTGISVGWVWGYGQSPAKDNIVESNYIHHIGKLSNGDGPILSDMGGIYTLGIQPGTVIRNNIIHDINGYKYGGWGIYFDEGSSSIVAENNLVYRTTHGGFDQHYGKENIVRNNIFAFGRDTQLNYTRKENHLGFTFERNIVYWTEGALLKGEGFEDNFQNLKFDNNLYWKVGGEEILFGKLSWEEWQARGMDKNSIIADPWFVAPTNRDFRLKPDSPAFELGFKSLPNRQRGVSAENRLKAR